MHKRLLGILVVVFLLTTSIFAAQAQHLQPSPAASLADIQHIQPPAEGIQPMMVTPACAGAFQNDDGSIENGYSFNPSFGINDLAYFAEPYTMPETPYEILQACICLTRIGVDTDLAFDVVLFNDNAGQPGTELARVSTFAAAVPIWPATTIYDVPLNVQVNVTNLWVGVNWNVDVEVGFFFCADEDGPSPSLGRTTIDGGTTWDNPNTYWVLYKAMFIRAEGQPVEEEEEEVPAVNYPNRGEILISAGAPVVPYAAPGEYAQAFTLPADYDGNGFDTYIITGTATVGGATWYSIWVGGVDYLWVPASQVQILR